MTRGVTRTLVVGMLALAVNVTVGAVAARAQGMGTSGSLGGYGGQVMDTGAGSAMSGPVIPYGGRFAGFMPYRMGGSASLSFTTRGPSAMESTRPSFSLSRMSGGMSSMSAGAGSGLSGGSGMFSAPGAMGSSGGMSSMPGTRGMGVMPPSFAYPFRQPPSLLPAETAGAGMSM